SAMYWQENKDQICSWFELTKTEVEALEAADVAGLADDKMAALADQVVEFVWRAVQRFCLVLMPFDDAAKRFFADVLGETVRTAGFTVVRIDLEPEGGDIFSKFLDHLARADVVVADVTDFNPNVMHEVGHVHAAGMQPFLYHRGSLGDDAADELPFYLKGHAVEAIDASVPTD